ncbi:hypothetical protein [Methylobacter tundripaludum]|uniref:hypothetical protein n=1 Tax=Methylobacter tundripaludum TaxID=173365 RepID=UPI00123799A1|nr:hypothetical protein [Methylobacter tundripaludum]
MNSNKQHKKVSLAGNADCRVVFCPDCGTLEITLGATKIHTNCESLHILSSVLNHAKVRIAQMQDASPANRNTRPTISRIH